MHLSDQVHDSVTGGSLFIRPITQEPHGVWNLPPIVVLLWTEIRLPNQIALVKINLVESRGEKEQSFHNIRLDYLTTISLSSPGRGKSTLKKQLAKKKLPVVGQSRQDQGIPRRPKAFENNEGL